MDLQLENQQFIVCGVSSGFGNAAAQRLMAEGARVCGVARSSERLEEMKESAPELFDFISGDLTRSSTLDRIEEFVDGNRVEGAVINAAGPPPGHSLEFSMDQWDEAYELVMRWKIDLIQRLIPKMKEEQYGRILLVESQSIKQPIPALVLSNAFRAGIAGFAKTLAQEIAGDGITVNILAPGAHTTPAIERVIEKKAENKNISIAQARQSVKENIPVGRMGKPEEFSSIATWLLSPLSSYVTGQVLSHEGGNIKGLFG